MKKARLKRVYGLSHEGFQALLETTPNCPICGRDITTSPHIDHDHESGNVRSLLCGPCNRAIGLLGDNPQTAFNAFKYLEKHKS